MLQVRAKDGDNRWFNPERDLVYAFPRVLAKALQSLDEFTEERYKEHNTSKEEAGRVAVILGQLTSGSIKNCTDDERMTQDEIKEKLQDLELNSAFKLISGLCLNCLMGEFFYSWASQVTPKTKNDIGIDLRGLDEIDEFFMKGE